jgi:hypothetical protein
VKAWATHRKPSQACPNARVAPSVLSKKELAQRSEKKLDVGPLVDACCCARARGELMSNRAVISCVVGVCTLLGYRGTAGAEEPEKSTGAGPVFSTTGPDAAAYGAARGFPLGTKATTSEVQHLVALYSHFDEIFPARAVAHAAVAWSFRRAPTELKIAYAFQSNVYSLEDYLSRNPTTGLLIAKDDTILFEHYQFARSDRDRFLS